MILLDTTVLCYAVGSAHAFRDPCRHLLTGIRSGDIRASTSIEVVQEFVHVRSRRRSRDDAVALARDYVRLLSPLVQPDEDTLDEALRLYVTTTALGSFDALLAALALQGPDILVSADHAFAAMPGLRHVVPDAAGVASLR